MKRAYAFLVLSAAALLGQSSIGGPPSEYVFDPGTNAIRAIVGAPGSAYLGNPVISGLQFGAVAPNGRSAIVVSGRASDFIADLTQLSAAPLSLAGAVESPDQVLWAQDSSGAVLFSSRGRSMQFVTQINQQPIVQPRIDLSTLERLPEVAATSARSRDRRAMFLLAVDPEAKLGVIAIGGVGRSDVYLIQNGMAPQLLLNLESAGAAAFAGDGSLYVMDAAAGKLSVVRNPSGNPQVQSLTAPQGSSGQPVAIAVQGNLLYVAVSVDNRIGVYDLTTFQAIDGLELDSAPSTLALFNATSFLVNARRNPTDPVLLLETSPSRKIIFIPSGAKQ